MGPHPRAMPPASHPVDPRPTRPRAMSRPGRRRAVRPLEQIPVWAEPIDRRRAPGETTDGASGLDALLAGLNAEQLRAVTHGEGPLLVVAGAGTGKTQVVTRRIAWLIATRRARPSEILALTFTDKAAAEMQVRVDQLVPYGYTDTAISTFHAFGDRLIREYALELGLAPDVRVLSRPEVVIFLRERLFDLDLEHYRPLGDPTRFLGALATHFSRLKDEDVEPDAYLAHADREVGEAALLAELADEGDPADDTREAAAAAVEAAARQLELARAYARYQALLSAEGFIDFGDQVALALRLLRRSPAARREVRRRFRYILVDEFQDTNRAQAELVELIAEPHRNVTVVGDDDQSIYRFRGAAMSNIVEFRDRPRRPKVVVLRRNYRSRAGILTASHRLIRFNDPDRLEVHAGIDKRLRAAAPGATGRPAPGGDPPRGVRDRLGGGRLDRPRDRRPGRRRRRAAGSRHPRPVQRRGRRRPAQPERGRPAVAVLGIVRPVRPPGGPAPAGVPAGGGRPRIERRRLRPGRIGRVRPGRRGPDRDRGQRATAEPDRLGGARGAGSSAGTPAPRAGQPGRRRSSRQRTSATTPSSPMTGRPARCSTRSSRGRGCSPGSRRATAARSEEALQNVARFFDVVRAQSALLADDRCPFVAGHLRTLIEAGDDPPTAELDGESDAVAVLTVHKAKGLEFPTVFLVGLVDGRFPSTSRRDPLAIPAVLARRCAGRGRRPPARGAPPVLRRDDPGP